ncbi:MAG: hypothetical protein WC667_04995 [Sulfurimonas sp.]|jgi:hypothetical protein
MFEENLCSICDINGNVLKISNSFSVLIETKKELLIGARHYDLLNHNKQGREIFLSILDKVKVNKYWKGMLKMRTARGKLLYFDTKVLLVNNKNVMELLWIKKEVTNNLHKDKYCSLTNLRNKSSLIQFLSKKHPHSKTHRSFYVAL